MKILYFAYGSCMDDADFRRTVPTAKRVGAAVLLDYRLDFSVFSAVRNGGAADIIPTIGEMVEGVLWEIDSLTRLDAREGHPYVYKRTSVDIVHLDTAEYLPAITYVAGGKDIPTAPKLDYLNLMIQGAESVGVSDSYIEAFRDRANDLPDAEEVYPFRTKRKAVGGRGSSYSGGSSYSTGGGTPWNALWSKYDAEEAATVSAYEFEPAPSQSRELDIEAWEDATLEDEIGADLASFGIDADELAAAELQAERDARADDVVTGELMAREDARADLLYAPMALTAPPVPKMPKVQVRPEVLFQLPALDSE